MNPSLLKTNVKIFPEIPLFKIEPRAKSPLGLKKISVINFNELFNDEILVFIFSAVIIEICLLHFIIIQSQMTTTAF